MHRSHSLVTTSKKSLPVACHSSEFRGFEKTPNLVCGFLQCFFFSLFLPGLASLFSATPLPSPVFLLRCPQQPQQLVPEWREQAGLPRCQAIVTERFTLLSGSREPHREIGFSDNLLIQAIHSSSPSLPFWRGLFLLVPQEPVPETPLPHLWRPLFTNSTL